MQRFTRVYLLLALLASGGASAQMYKIIGPDGKISYSDRPPVDTNAKVSVVKSHGVVHTPTPAPVAATAPAPEDKAAQAKETLKKLAATPGLLAGLAAVLDTTALVNQSAALCAKLPKASEYSNAKDAWHQRNAPIIAQHKTVYESMYPAADRASFADKLGGRVAKKLDHQVNTGNEASLIKWCDKSMDEVRTGKLDLADKEGVDVLMKVAKP